MFDGQPQEGWFQFEAPPPGVRTFEFHDADQNFVIRNIKLIDRIIVDADFDLANYPLKLTYRLAQWEPKMQEDGSLALEHKQYPGCTIQDRPSGEPQGKFKIQTKLGEVTYDIYGYLDQPKGLGFREYVTADAFAGVDAGTKPFLLIQIPLKDSAACVLGASDVLSTLSAKPQSP
jgi:hypothetical protein